MNLRPIFQPRPILSEAELAHGLRMLTWEGVASLSFGSITTSGFLAAFALALGANNFQIGVLASLPFITQPLQIPFILLVERVRRRKAIAVTTWIAVQMLWLPIALIPVFLGVPGAVAVTVLLGLMAIRGVLTAATNCAWHGWIRDLVPQRVLGSVFSRRLSMATLAAAGFGLVAALFVDYWRNQVSQENAVLGYTVVLLFGALFLGLASPVFMARMPEPLMQPQTGAQPSLRQLLSSPLRDANFRHLMRFLFLWSFALNLAVPFLAVYMLVQLEMPLSGVIALGVVSQLANVLFFRLWGVLVDRFASKSILSISASLYLLIILGWTFTAMPDRYSLTVPLLAVLHVFAGAAAAGVTLTVGTIGLKLAPQGQATPYLTSASLATNLGAGLGPLAGGLFVDFFRVRSLSLDFTWTDPTRVLEIPAINLTGYDFLFALTFFIGIATLNTLARVREEGEVGRELVLEELMAQTREVSRAVSSVPGLRFVTQFPYSYLRHVPGMDVAMGITAYQVASATRNAAVGMERGLEAAGGIAARVSHAVSELVEQAGGLGKHGGDLARHATRGALHAFDEVSEDIGHLARESVKGVLDALSFTSVDPEEAFYGIGYGVVQGGIETDAALGDVASQAIEGAREMAGQLGLTEQEAAFQVVEGLLQAAQELGTDAVAQVEEALPPEMVAASQGLARGKERPDIDDGGPWPVPGPGEA